MKRYLNALLFLSITVVVNAQSIDKVEAIIGDEIVLTSEIESQYLQYLSQGNAKSEAVKCEIIEDLLFQKLLINQAKIDSVLVSDDEVDAEITKRLTYFQSQLGSVAKVEEYFGKSKVEIELELGKVIKDQFLAERIQRGISSDVKVTPAEVKEFFNQQNNADIPVVPAKVEVTQVIVKPEISEEHKDKLRDKLNSFRERVYKGEDFKMLATLYSDDLGSATRGGELGFVNRGDLVPEFERAAFRLKKGEISEVVESQFGFHIVQLIERRGEQINVRHILLKNKVSSTALYNAKLKIEKVEKELKAGTITFDEAVEKYSDDESKNNNGLLLNPNTMSTLHVIDEMSPTLKFVVENLKEGSFSSPAVAQIPDETKAYRILKLNKKIDEHKANLVDDFSMIKDFAINIKKQEELMKWIAKTISNTYIKINDDISACEFKNKWVK
jgi:peptidyl-prolyl cis-trans isomerase SurA